MEQAKSGAAPTLLAVGPANGVCSTLRVYWKAGTRQLSTKKVHHKASYVLSYKNELFHRAITSFNTTINTTNIFKLSNKQPKHIHLCAINSIYGITNHNQHKVILLGGNWCIKHQFSPNKFSPNKFSPNKFSPNKFSPNKFSPNKFSPNKFSPNKFPSNKFPQNRFAVNWFPANPKR